MPSVTNGRRVATGDQVQWATAGQFADSVTDKVGMERKTRLSRITHDKAPFIGGYHIGRQLTSI
jgi:hypothetical protein